MADIYLSKSGDGLPLAAGAHVWRRLFDIDEREALFETRGFRRPNESALARLELVGKAFISGYREALFSGPAGPRRALLGLAPEDLRGFVAEGAGMGCVVADTCSFGDRRLRCWIDSTARDFSYLTHVGVGWAMARIPFGWRSILRQLDPIHHWLAFDGMGFHDTYFHAGKVLGGWRRVWRGYRSSAYDQGVGRALWFVSGADIAWAAATIASLPPDRRGDLWSGLGLAIAYAGCADADALDRAKALAGRHAAGLAQGAAFAAAAHAQAGAAPAHTRFALQKLTGLDLPTIVARVAAARDALPEIERDGPPRYELWRGAISEFISERSSG